VKAFQIPVGYLKILVKFQNTSCFRIGYKAEDLNDYNSHTWSDDCNANETHKIEARQNKCLNSHFCEEAFEFKSQLKVLGCA
jgi:hypothetical protein